MGNRANRGKVFAGDSMAPPVGDSLRHTQPMYDAVEIRPSLDTWSWLTQAQKSPIACTAKGLA